MSSFEFFFIGATNSLNSVERTSLVSRLCAMARVSDQVSGWLQRSGGARATKPRPQPVGKSIPHDWW